MDDERDESIQLVKCTNSIDRELELKILLWYLNRFELGYSSLGIVVMFVLVALPMAFFDLLWLGMPIALITGVPVGMCIIGRWKYNRRPTYRHDTFYELGLIGERESYLKRIKKPLVLVPEAKPTRSEFAGTRFGGLARTEEVQELYGLPNWCEIDETGTPKRRILAHESAIGSIVIRDWVEGDGPAPAYWADCEPGPERTERDMVRPRIGYRLESRPVTLEELR